MLPCKTKRQYLLTLSEQILSFALDQYGFCHAGQEGGVNPGAEAPSTVEIAVEWAIIRQGLDQDATSLRILPEHQNDAADPLTLILL